MPFDPYSPEPERPKLDRLGVLTASRAYLSDPEHWVTGVYHRGERVCAVGALMRTLRSPAQSDDFTLDLYTLVSTLERALPLRWRLVTSAFGCGQRRPLIAYNDTHSHQQVLRVFDRAIARERRRRAARHAV